MTSRGAALIVVLILSAIIYLAVSTALLMTMTEIHLSDFERRSIQAFYLAESAISKGVARLRTAPEDLTLFSDTVPGKLDAFTVSFSPTLYKEHDSRYQLVLQGEGVISGSSSSLTRRVTRYVLLKPFALFADQQIVIRDHCRIDGNIHGNQLVDLGAHVKVDGHVSSALSEAIVSGDADLPEGEEPVLEPEIEFPLFPSGLYYPKYLYNNQIYEAQTLELTTSISLSSEDPGLVPPAGTLNVYRAKADLDKNPAGIFLLQEEIDDEAHDTLSIIDVQGGSLLLSASASFRMKGLIRIIPFENFPALLRFGIEDTSVETISFEDIQDFLDVKNSEIAKFPKKNSIEGLLYSLGDIMLTAESGRVALEGSIWARNITLKGNATCAVDFAPRLLTNPPPGLKVVEYGEWREMYE